ncbi:response regulator [Gloeobacter kilaueensis]|uniref:Two component transcriptional regulator, LuxR family n=1 Tax=Gloeobacter kilaueensis (strain ATCC BAA-2537 / CCAP 1431/1 / ULC 316 / JS1) TaxID=1183438 RepID=U5QPN8_GLOK1|nr:response regulator transcription factor [Gloeobacter kilaueensis]AGY59589.1 two component transcriptional regulator, LuxR family [Gloeobacter kilaueensis JS1]
MVTAALSILLVDDEQRFRQGLRTLLNFYSSAGPTTFEIVGEAASVEQAMVLVGEQRPALVLLDLELARGDGVALLEQLREGSYHGKVLVLSAHQEDDWVFRAMQAGACGYVFKTHLASQLGEAIATVMRDEIYLPPEVATQFFRLFHYYSGRSLQARSQIHLTEREQEVLYWLVRGASNEEIAKNLYITIATVKAHLTAIFEKLQVTSRTQAIVAALKLGLVQA